MQVHRLLPLALVLALGAMTTASCGGADINVTDPGKKNRKARGKRALKLAIEAETENNAQRAEKYYRRALEFRPEHPETNRRAIAFFISRGATNEAVRFASDYVDSNPGDPSAYHLLADAHIADGDNITAVETLDELIRIDNGDASAYEKRGRVFILNKELQKGILDLRRAVDLAPENGTYIASLGSALTQADRLREAIKLLRRAIKANPESARAHRLLGTALRSEMETRKALKHHEQAVLLAPDSARAFFELAITQNILGKNADSEKNLRKSLDLDDRDAVTWYAYAELMRVTKRFRESIPAYEKALEIDPNHTKAPAKLGLVLLYDNQLDRAEQILRTAIRIDPNSPYPFFNLGMVYEKGEKYGQAIGSFEKFLQLAPSGDGDIGVAKRKIKSLRSKLRGRY
jgi:tetratricopeptide (TPR) repeat protein